MPIVDRQFVAALNDALDAAEGLRCQPRGQASFMLRRAHMIFGAIRGKSGPGVYFKLTKQEVGALIRGALWADGWHLIERSDLGKRVMVLEGCTDHSECRKEAR